jgi:myosin-1
LGGIPIQIHHLAPDTLFNLPSTSDLQFPAFLLGLSPAAIKEKITKRKLESRWGNQTEEIDVNLNVEQAVYTRDAWVKAMYSRLFDFLVSSVNKALNVNPNSSRNVSIGILDIYGFEIFDSNGFEQFWWVFGKGRGGDRES